MDNLTHNSSSSSSWDLDMSLGSHHHPLLFSDTHHPNPPPPPQPLLLPFHLGTHHHPPPPAPHHPPHHGHAIMDPSPSSSLFPPHHHHHRLLGLDIDPSSHHHRQPPSYHDPGEQQHDDLRQHQHQDTAGAGDDDRAADDRAAGVEDVEEELGAMKEMMYRIAAMQPVDIDPATIKKPRRRNVRISEDPQSVAARHRRERISERIRILQRLVPGGTKMDTASMLDEAIRYIKFLKRQVQELQHPPATPSPAAAAAQQYPGAGGGAGAAGPSSSRPGPPFLPLGPGPLIDWAGLVRPVDIHGPTSSSSSSSMGGAHAALGFGFSSAGQSSHGMH